MRTLNNSSERFAVKFVGSCGQFSFLFQMLMSVLKIISLFYSKLSRSDPYYFVICAPLIEHAKSPLLEQQNSCKFFFVCFILKNCRHIAQWSVFFPQQNVKVRRGAQLLKSLRSGRGNEMVDTIFEKLFICSLIFFT